jgi:hypothetical protein
VSLRTVLEAGELDSGPLADPVQVVVFNDGDRSVGMVVDQIVDVVEEAVTVRKKWFAKAFWVRLSSANKLPISLISIR